MSRHESGVRLRHMLDARPRNGGRCDGDSVDFDLLWQIITDDLPPLITALEEALKA